MLFEQIILRVTFKTIKIIQRNLNINMKVKTIESKNIRKVILKLLQNYGRCIISMSE